LKIPQTCGERKAFFSPSQDMPSLSSPVFKTPPAPNHSLCMASSPLKSLAGLLHDEDCVTPTYDRHAGIPSLHAMSLTESKDNSSTLTSYFSWKRVGSRNTTPTASPASIRVIKKRR
jgi:hypothetical protein